MNPLTNVKNITKLNEIELSSGLIHKKSWHDMYKDSAWIFIGGLAYGLTEGDIITVFSEYGEVVNINLVRDKKTGKTKGFCFLCYANQKSTILAVDNLNGIKLCSRTIRVDHVANYKPPKEDDRDDEITKMLKSEGCAPQHLMVNENSMASNDQAKKKKLKKEKKEKKRKKRKHSSAERESETKASSVVDLKIKKEKPDPGYDKYDIPSNKSCDNGRKRKYEDRKYEYSLDESSHSLERFRAKSGQSHSMPNEKDGLRNDDKFLKYRSKERPVSESEHKEAHREKDKHEASLLRRVKRRRSSSSSSDDRSRNREDKAQYKAEKSQSKSRYSNSERKFQENKQSSSSSSDEDSSSQSSTDDEKHKKDTRNSKRDKYKSREEKKSLQEERQDKSDHRSENSNYTYHRSGHSDKTERDFEYRSKGKYKSDERDSHSRDSYHRSRYDKR